MDIRVDLKRLKAAVFGVDLTTVEDNLQTPAYLLTGNALEYLRRQVTIIETKLSRHLEQYYAMDADKATAQVAAAIESGKLFRVQVGLGRGSTDKSYSPMVLGQKSSPNNDQIGEAAKSSSRASDGTLWCEDRQLMCAGLIRNGWVLVPKELL